MTSYQRLKQKVKKLEQEKLTAQMETRMLAYPSDYSFMEVETIKLRCSLEKDLEKLVWFGNSTGNGLLSQIKQ